MILSTIGSIASGLLQYTFARDHASRQPQGRARHRRPRDRGRRPRSRRPRSSFPPFAVANLVSRIGGAPQHPVGNALLAEQFPPNRLGSAIAVHVAGGNVGTVVVGFAAALTIGLVGWRGAVLGLGIAAFVVAIAILVAVSEARVRGRPRSPPRPPSASSIAACSQDRNLRWVYLAAVLGGGSRGLGVLNIFVPLYLDQVLGLDTATIGLMYGVLLAASVPGPLVAGWLSDRVGRKPVIIGVYVGGACSIALFVLAGSDIAGLWAGIIAAQPVLVRREPAAPGAPRRRRPGPDARRRVQHLLRAGVRGGVDVGDRLRARDRRRRRRTAARAAASARCSG